MRKMEKHMDRWICRRTGRKVGSGEMDREYADGRWVNEKVNSGWVGGRMDTWTDEWMDG